MQLKETFVKDLARINQVVNLKSQWPIFQHGWSLVMHVHKIVTMNYTSMVDIMLFTLQIELEKPNVNLY